MTRVIEGAWRMESYVRNGDAVSLSGVLLLAAGRWSTLYFVPQRGTDECWGSAEAGRYEVLGLVSIAVFGSWWWHTEDMNDSTARGAIFDAMKKTMIRSLRIY